MRLNSLKLKTVSFIVVVVVIFNGYNLYKGVTDLVNNQRKNMEHVSSLFVDAQALSSVKHYWTLDYDNLEKILDGFESFPEFSSATFYDEKGKLIAQRVVPVEYLRENSMIIRKEIFYEEGDEPVYLGYLVYEASYDNIDAFAMHMLTDGIKAQLVLAFVLVTLIFWIINRLIVTPIERLSGCMAEVAKGEMKVDIPYTMRKDSIGVLARSLLIFKEKLFTVIEFERQGRKDAEEVNKLKDTFFAKITHELRTPLHGIRGFISLILTALKDKHYDDMQVNAENVDKLAENMSLLVNDILDFSKLREGAIKIVPHSCNLKDVLQGLISSAQPLASNNNNKLHLNIKSQIPEFLMMDSMRVEQVLLNLLSNACKFTKEGDVTLSVEAVSQKGDVCAVRFEVADTGIGMSDQFIKEGLFRSFMQEEDSLSRSYGGTGLGLAIAYNFVDLMRGMLDVVSEKGKGSKFYFTLPLEIDHEAENSDHNTKCEDMKVKYEGRPLQLLVADDDPMNRMLLVKLIEKLGHTCITANDGEEAINALQKNDIDLVLMDVMMPNKDGIEATKEIRGLDNNKNNVPIIAVTAFVKDENKKTCMNAGMDDFLTKPFNVDQLEKILCEQIVKDVA